MGVAAARLALPGTDGAAETAATGTSAPGASTTMRIERLAKSGVRPPRASTATAVHEKTRTPPATGVNLSVPTTDEVRPVGAWAGETAGPPACLQKKTR